MVLSSHVALLNSKRLARLAHTPAQLWLKRLDGHAPAGAGVRLTTPRGAAAPGLQFEVSVSTFEETLDKSSFASAADYARETALHKAIEVAQRRLGDGQLADLVIGADTIVEAGGQILEKPRDERNATQMLSSLSGTRHAVHTGVALIFPRSVDSGLGVSPLVVSFAETTHVQFADLTPETIAAYIATGEPFGKAGAYGIQGVASSFVQSVTGCYFNVVGFPLHRFSSELVQRLQAGVLS